MIPPAGKVWLITGTAPIEPPTSLGYANIVPRVPRLVSGADSIVLARGDRVIATARTLSSITHFLEDDTLCVTNLHCAELDIGIGTERVKEQIDAIIKASGWGTVDVLINNAGVGIPAFVEEGGSELMRSQYQINVFGTLDVTTAVLPYMRKQGSGTVVTIGSRSAWKPEIKGMGFYGSSKAAIHAIMEAMAVELEPFGIRMLIVEPGSFRTEGIYRNEFSELGPISDYDDKRGPAAKAFAAPSGKQAGDPAKAMKALVEVVCGEGRARGKAWPLYLVLGKDAERDVRRKCTLMLDHLDEWSDIVRDVDLDNLN